MSSTRPSTKYSCSGSPLMFWNGSAAMDGFSRTAGAAAAGFAAGEGLGASRAPTCSA